MAHPGTVAILVINIGFNEGVEEEIENHPQHKIILSHIYNIVSVVEQIIETAASQQLIEVHQENQQLRSEFDGF